LNQKTNEVKEAEKRSKEAIDRLLRRCGRTNLKLSELPQVHMEFLETSCQLWPYTLKKYRAQKNNDADSLEKLKQEERPIIDKMTDLLMLEYVGRRTRLNNARENPDEQQAYKEKCKEDPIYFLNNFGVTFDPRLAAYKLSSKYHPMCLWPDQERIAKNIISAIDSKTSMAIVKSRGYGLSWLICGIAVWYFLFRPGFVAKICSRKEDLVDQSNNPDTLFWKIRHQLYLTPRWMRPAPLQEKKNDCDAIMRISNPDLSSAIIGEAGDNIGAGGRSTVAFNDEKALYENAEAIDRALSGNTDCQIDLSTPRGMNHFGKKFHSGAVKTDYAWWYFDPAKNPSWKIGRPSTMQDAPELEDVCPWLKFQYEAHSNDPVIIQQEILINWNASVEGLFIPPEWVSAAVNYDLVADGEKTAGFDVAGYGKDEAVYISRIGPVVSYPYAVPYKHPSEAVWAVVERCEREGIRTLNYDMDGIGQSVLDVLEHSERAIRFRCEGIHSNSAAPDERIEEEGRTGQQKYRNLRAYLWDNLRQRFEKTWRHRNGLGNYNPSEMISIPNDELLIQQISAPLKQFTTGGKIKVESKDDMKRRGVSSPDRADALVYCFMGADASDRVVSTFDYTADGGHFQKIRNDILRESGDRYASIYQGEDFTVSGIVASWSGSSDGHNLKIWGEFVEANADPEKVVEIVRGIARSDIRPIREWIANDEMMRDIHSGKQAPYWLYKKTGANLHQNYTTEHRSSIMLVNKMFDSGLILVDSSCRVLMHQLNSWVKVKGRPEPGLGLVLALCNLVTRLRKKDKNIDRKIEFKEYQSYHKDYTRLSAYA
jgi:hypothetical protein